MDKEILQTCHTTALGAAGRLRLPLRSKVWRGQAGEFSGSGSGSSMDFQDHRAYSPGDDPRHINWQAYARTGHYTMKLFREEVRPVVDLIMDVSESHFFQAAKARRTAELFYLITASSVAAGASISIHLVKGNATSPVDPASVASHTWLESARKLKPSDPSTPPDLSRIPLRANSIRVLLSDLLFPGDPDPILRYLSQRHGSAVIFSPYVQEEAKPAWDGNYDFIDAENETRHPHRIEPAVLKRYEEAYTTHFSTWKHAARRYQAAYARIPAEEELASALFREAIPTGALEAIR